MSECVVRMNIKEMPAACGPCELSCTFICKEWAKIDRKEIGRTKSPDCPIIAILPEGHGRLIDAEKLKAKKYHSDITHENAVAVAEIDWAETIVPADAERSET